MTRSRDKNIKLIYNNGDYLKNNKEWHEEDSPYKASYVQKIISKNGVTFNSCADVGCGAGLVTELLAKKYTDTDFIGFDLAAGAKTFWSRRDAKNLKFMQKSVSEQDTVFDLVICLDVFEHIEDFYSFLRVLKASGRKFIFNIPLDMSVMKLLTSGIKNVREEVGHIHYFSEYTALETLKDCGYKIDDSFLSVAFLLVPPRNSRQLAVLPFRLITLLLGRSIAARLFGGMSLVVLAE
jgi:SAM-dependent methyltransferase